VQTVESEDVWLRFFLRRLRLSLRQARSPAVNAVLTELITVAEERLDRLEQQRGREDQASD